VTGLLSGQRPGATTAYTVGFDAAGYDETKYSRLSADHFGARTVEYQVTRKDVRELLPQLATTHDEPFGNASVLAAYCCARAAVADGQTRLLAGDGGDELFGGNERYRTQLMFDRYGAIPGALRRGLLEPLASVGWLSRVPVIRKGPGFIRQASRPLPDRLQSYNFLERTSPSRIFAADFLAGLDTDHPFAVQRATWAAVPDAGTLDKMLFLDWQITLADNDLRKVDRACDLAGLEVTYPFLDDDIVDFSLAIPADWKVRGPTLRHFFKRAMVGFLPDATLAKSKQGFGLPFGVWAKEDAQLRDVIRGPVEFLQGSGIVQKTYVDELWRRHEHESAAYYGVFLWVLANLGMWLDAHRSKFS
jgi:asparagine synthase (glutamine-hydrolysing)